MLDKKVVKHDFPKGSHVMLEFCVKHMPMDATQVIQYSTLYQVPTIAAASQ